ncbi:YrhB domain-containing protein [Streptomyces sp. NPDC021100]|uniref:YrhB domain-containing protein n=1 Tax=Streptomyces sp. NPDC021100 TaxID=3365114 RepID=UPI0037A1333A
MTLPARLASQWLKSAYGGLVEVSAQEPVSENSAAWELPCRIKSQTERGRPLMLTASVIVPKNGATPFHPCTSNPAEDLREFAQNPAPRSTAFQATRTNVRGRLLALDAALDGARATALPWNPSHEAPGWWERLLHKHFPSAEASACKDWNEAISAVAGLGPGARGIAWIRRETSGMETTGHLLYLHNNDGQVILLDPARGGLGSPESGNVRNLTLARFRKSPHAGSFRPRSANDFPAAVQKAKEWLRFTYGNEVDLVDPHPADETTRGWLFACNTKRYIADRDPKTAMLDSALVVPKNSGVPFGLPNADPWRWLDNWDAGAGGSGVPSPGEAAWLQPTMGKLGTVLSFSEHTHQAALLRELQSFPVGSRALVWLRRTDGRGRESVGLLLNAYKTPQGLRIAGDSAGALEQLEVQRVHTIHVIRYRPQTEP